MHRDDHSNDDDRSSWFRPIDLSRSFRIVYFQFYFLWPTLTPFRRRCERYQRQSEAKTCTVREKRSCVCVCAMRTAMLGAAKIDISNAQRCGRVSGGVQCVTNSVCLMPHSLHARTHTRIASRLTESDAASGRPSLS